MRTRFVWRGSPRRPWCSEPEGTPKENHGSDRAHTARHRRGRVAGQATRGAHEGALAALGDARFRHAVRGVPALRRQGRPLGPGRPAVRRHDPRHRLARRPRRLVVDAGGVPEGHRLDAAVRGARAGLWVRPADDAVPAAAGLIPPLAAARHDPAAAVARARPRHAGFAPHAPRRHAVRRGHRGGAVRPALAGGSRSRADRAMALRATAAPRPPSSTSTSPTSCRP
jgi:hypothetical protein